MSYEILSDIYRTAEVTDFGEFPLEDVLITGILRQKAYNSTEGIVALNRDSLGVRTGLHEDVMWHFGEQSLVRAFEKAWKWTQCSMVMSEAEMNENQKDINAQFFHAIFVKPHAFTGFKFTKTQNRSVPAWKNAWNSCVYLKKNGAKQINGKQKTFAKFSENSSQI